MSDRLAGERMTLGRHYADDPEFYCHGQKCIDGGCDPLHCADQDDDQMTWGDSHG